MCDIEMCNNDLNYVSTMLGNSKQTTNEKILIKDSALFVRRKWKYRAVVDQKTVMGINLKFLKALLHDD